MVHSGLRLRAVFYRSATGREPVRNWLKRLNRDARTEIGSDIRVVQLKWPVGMPLVRFLGDGLLELRCRLSAGQARVIFLIDRDRMVLLHAFMKKSRKTPKKELQLAQQRAARWHMGGAVE